MKFPKSSVPWKERFRTFLWQLRDNKRAKVIIMISVILILFVVAIIVARVVSRRSHVDVQPETVQWNMDSEQASEMRRFLDGVMVPSGKENLFPVSVMIENLVTVRPQSGLQKANVVYEALAEGGITRFLAVYSSDVVLDEIGPVRSARPYFVDWAKEYGALYVHVGGSPQVLSTLRDDATSGVVNLDQMVASPYFWRKKDIAAPHNLFTSSKLLVFALHDRNFLEKPGVFAPWQFTAPLKKEERPTEEKRLTIDYFSASYKVEYTYDRGNNEYLRSNGGVAHIDKISNEQIHVKNVVVQFVTTSLLEEETGRLNVGTQGEGRAVIFQNGSAIEGTWRNDSDTGMRTRFFTKENEEIQFIPGNIWIEVLPDSRTLSYN